MTNKPTTKKMDPTSHQRLFLLILVFLGLAIILIGVGSMAAILSTI